MIDYVGDRAWRSVSTSIAPTLRSLGLGHALCQARRTFMLAARRWQDTLTRIHVKLIRAAAMVAVAMLYRVYGVVNESQWGGGEARGGKPRLCRDTRAPNARACCRGDASMNGGSGERRALPKPDSRRSQRVLTARLGGEEGRETDEGVKHERMLECSEFWKIRLFEEARRG
jgi:hypothetical protein